MNKLLHRMLIAVLLLVCVISIVLGITQSDNTIIGYSEHGIPILKKDLNE